MQKDLMRPEIPDECGFKELQNAILNIMADIDAVCAANNINYYILGGTALGAQRHGGFIPWDDDLDIYMFPEDYKRFREVFLASEYAPQYHIQEFSKDGDRFTFSKVRANGTTYIQPVFKNKKMHHGIYVDIFLLHTSPKSKFRQLTHRFWFRYVVMLELMRRDYDKKGMFRVVKAILKLFPKNFLKHFAMKQMYKYDGKDTGVYCDHIARKLKNTLIFPAEWFRNPVRVPFETITLMASKNQPELLELFFGDWTQIPPPEEIARLQHSEIWDTHKDYTHYLPGADSLEDEGDI